MTGRGIKYAIVEESISENAASLRSCLLIPEDFTVYKIAHSDVAEKPEAPFKSLKILVGERGFEPPTPWSRTRFQPLGKSGEIW